MMAAMLSLINEGDEAVIFEPFYENYGPDAIVSGARPRYVRMAWPDWTVDEEALKAAFTDRTKVLILNTPNNPTGKVFTRDELRTIADLCTDHDVVAVTDEIYEHIVFNRARHVSLATIGEMAERTITINGLSKTYSATGWRIGWAIAPKTLASAMRRTHDFLTVGAPHPLQIAAVAALNLPESYYADLARSYQAKRDFFVRGLRDVGLDCRPPGGAYYVIADFERFPFEDDWAFAVYLVERLRVAVGAGSSFYGDPVDGRRYVRFMFSKRDETLREAIERLRDLRDVPSDVRRRGHRPRRRQGLHRRSGSAVGEGPRDPGRPSPGRGDVGEGGAMARSPHDPRRPSGRRRPSGFHRRAYPHGRFRRRTRMDSARWDPRPRRRGRPAPKGGGCDPPRRLGRRNRLGRGEMARATVPHARGPRSRIDRPRRGRPPDRLPCRFAEFEGPRAGRGSRGRAGL